MTYKARIFTREELRKAFERVTDVYELSAQLPLETAHRQRREPHVRPLRRGNRGGGMKPRVYDDLVQSAVELSCFGTGQSTIEEGRAAYQAWLKEHDRQIAEKAWEEGYIQAVKNMNPMPGEESPEYTPNPYRKENA